VDLQQERPVTQRHLAVLALALGVLFACDAPSDPEPCAPAAEICNGADDDCDGDVDEELGAIACGTGACARSVAACADGVEGACTPGEPAAAEACDGAVDDDCDGDVDEGCACADGETRACYGGPAGTSGVGACVPGTQACEDGAWGACEGDVGPAGELCNGADDDCDGSVDEGNPEGGAACTPAAGSCGGILQCSAGALACTPNPPAPDVCDGLDNDCDPSTPDGSADGRVGTACDGTDADLCQEGTLACGPAGEVVCSDASTATVDLCNGLDDDCNPATADGAGDPQVSAPCDGPDADLCAEGALVCSGGSLACSDASSDTPDVCDGVDNDCNPATPDGAADGRLGTACDGPDGDLCQEGTLACGPAGEVVCSDASTTTADLCNGVDDDCSPTTPDGSGDPQVSTACDGPDGDLCAEGVLVCGAGALACSDGSGDTPDVCDGVDNDCDPASADGSEHAGAGAPCDGPDADGCADGRVVCSGGAMVCDDDPAANEEVCNLVDDDCDGVVDEGCPP
jgi:hypothetical protein